MEHAKLSASAVGRWSKCTAAPLFEEQFPETTSAYAEEGRLAHSICELKVTRKFTNPVDKRSLTAALKKLKKEELYSDEMEKTSDAYVDYIDSLAMSYDAPPVINAEVRVNLSEWIPEGFGTSDVILVGGDMLDVVDYKHGKGVAVSAEGNGQLRLYALGALKIYEPIYGDAIKRVRMSIVQPRTNGEPTCETLTVEELREWGETIKPLAQEAYSGFGKFTPGEHCRFCRGKAQCRARANANTAFEDFKDIPLPTPENTEKAASGGTQVLTLEEIGDLLIRGKQIAAWYEDIEKFALKSLLDGKEIPGWKAVAGRSNRAFSDADAAIAAVIAAGFDEAIVYERKPKTLAELEKLMGDTAFKEAVGKYVIKPPGKPALAPMSDKREPYNAASADFAGVTKN